MEYDHTGFCLVCRRAHEPDDWLMDCIAEGDPLFTRDFLLALATAARAIRVYDMPANAPIVTLTPVFEPLWLGVPRWSTTQWRVLVNNQLRYALPTIVQVHFFLTRRRAEQLARRLEGRIERVERFRPEDLRSPHA